GPCGDGDDQSLQHVSREGDRLYRERAQQEGTGGSEKGRALRALSLTLGLTGRGDRGSGSTEERTEPRCRLFFGDFLFFLLLLFLLLFLLVGRTGCTSREGEHLGLGLGQQELDRFLRRELRFDREADGLRMSFREERSNRLLGRVGRREREGEGFHARLGNLAPDDHIVDRQRIASEDHPRLVRTTQVQ